MAEDTKETPQEGATQQEGVTVNLPKTVKVGYTDPITGEKITQEKNLADLTPDEIVSAIQKAHRFEQKMGDINREIEKKATQLAEQLANTKAEAKAQQLLEEIKRREHSITDEMLAKASEGDPDAIIKVLKAQQATINELRDTLTNIKTEQETTERLYRAYNENIDKALTEYPDVDEKLLVDFVKKTKIEPEMIGEVARTLSSLAKRDIDITKLNPNQRKKLEDEVKKSLESVPPPPIEGEVTKQEKPVPTTLDDMMDLAMKMLEEERK